MALNGISTETAGDPASGIATKLKRREDKLALAAAKRASVGTPGYRPLNVITGTRSAYVNGAGGASLQVMSGVVITGRPWSLTVMGGVPLVVTVAGVRTLSIVTTRVSGTSSWLLGDGQTQIANTCTLSTVSGTSVTLVNSDNQLLTYYAFSNGLTGSIPSLAANTALTEFSCASNALTGSIPSLAANTLLTHFYCDSNMLTGSIPSVAGNFSLTRFFCQENMLTGSIPSLLTNPAVTHFYCNNNQLTGSIPSLVAPTALFHFYCNNNQLTGSIPSLSTNTALSLFFCNSNMLTGSIPLLSANTNLGAFYCDTNSLSGSIPTLASNITLFHFVCYSNSLSGNIPSLSTNSVIVLFYCNNNQLTGWTGGTVSATLGDFQAQNNLLTQGAADAILAAFVLANRTTGTRILNIGGTGNATPSGAGLADKATLQGRGWTVTTN